MNKSKFIILTILIILVVLFALEYSGFNARYHTPQNITVKDIKADSVIAQ